MAETEYLLTDETRQSGNRMILASVQYYGGHGVSLTVTHWDDAERVHQAEAADRERILARLKEAGIGRD